MSWRDNKSRGGGYSRGRGHRQNRGDGNSGHHGSSDTQGENGNRQKQYPGHRGRGGYRGRPWKRPQSYHSYESKRPRYEVGNRLKEEDIGVTEFVGSHKRLAGLVKERFADFHVHEIDYDGQICKLTSQEIPPPPQDLKTLESLNESIPPEIREKLEAFSDPNSEIENLEIDVTEMTKNVRRNIHIIAKKVPSVVSETIERDGKKITVLAKKKGRSGHKFRGDNREDWTNRGGNYCHFLLHKVNMDTMDALNQLAQRLRIKSDNFHYAGTKDRRARTTQWVSVKKINPSNIHSAARQVRGAHVGNFKFAKEPLRLGMLKGNRFRIALRSVEANDAEIDEAVSSLRDNGFINYYGLQRFGSIAAIPTHAIGKALLQGKWDEAIELILKPRPGEQMREMVQAREIYHTTKNAAMAWRLIEKTGKIEAKLLRGIYLSGGHNPQGALDRLPRNARLMYIHAYQSFVWNHIVSRRIREFGSKPIVGDLVYENADDSNVVHAETIDYALNSFEEKEEKPEETEEKEEKSEELPKEEEEKKVEEEEKEKKVEEKQEEEKMEEEQVKESVSVSEEEKESDEKTVPKEDSDIPVEEISEMTVSQDETKEKAQENLPLDDSNLPAVKVLTEEDLPNYTLADVVMPKPGWKVTYPAYAKPWFDEILAKDGLTTDLRQKNMKYSLGGSYRKMLEKPGDLSYKIARYNGYHDDLLLCDIDEMRSVKLPEQKPDGKYKALILEFSLSSSTYATMALREILELDTSAQSQALQSAANQEQERKEEEAKKMEIDGGAAEGKDESKDAEDKKDTDVNAKDAETDVEKTAESEDSKTPVNTEAEAAEEKMEVAEDKKDTDVNVENAKTNVEQTAQSEDSKTPVNTEAEVAEEKMEVAEDKVDIPEAKDEPKKEAESTEKSEVPEKTVDNP